MLHALPLQLPPVHRRRPMHRVNQDMLELHLGDSTYTPLHGPCPCVPHVCRDSVAVRPPWLCFRRTERSAGCDRRSGVCRQGVWRRSALAAKQPTVFFLGDLNFRLRMTDADVRPLLRRGALDRLLARDELTPALGSVDGVFGGWREGAITFPPTFKFAKGTDRYVGDPLEGAGPSRGCTRRAADARLDVQL